MAALHGEGNIVRLVSCASGQSLRIRNGNVEGNGGQGDFAKFIVHKRGAHVMLQSWKESHYVAIREGRLTTGTGGPWCEFKVQSSNHAPGSAICLESVKLPGQHVGVLPSGDTKAPGNTGRGPHGSFTVELLQAAAPRAHHSHAPPPADYHEGCCVVL